MEVATVDTVDGRTVECELVHKMWSYDSTLGVFTVKVHWDNPNGAQVYTVVLSANESAVVIYPDGSALDFNPNVMDTHFVLGGFIDTLA